MKKIFVANTETKRSYEFNNVSDDIFIEPDIRKYTIRDNK